MRILHRAAQGLSRVGAPQSAGKQSEPATFKITSTLLKCLALAGIQSGAPAWAQLIATRDGWSFEISPYLWATAVRADVRTQLIGNQRLDVPFSDVASALDFAAMATLEARKGQWGAILDVQYVKLKEQRTPAALPAPIDIHYSQQIWTMVTAYRMLAEPMWQLDLLGGVRYLRVGAELTVSNPSLSSMLGRSQTSDWWDGVIGVRGFLALSSDWSLMGYVDVGRGGSDPSWQVVAGANYRLSESAAIKIGYRTIGFNRGMGCCRFR